MFSLIVVVLYFYEFLSRGVAVNEYHFDILRRLRKEIRKKHSDL